METLNCIGNKACALEVFKCLNNISTHAYKQDRRERGVGGVGGPGPGPRRGPQKLHSMKKLNTTLKEIILYFFIILKNHYTVSVSVKIKSTSFFRSLETMALWS